MQASIYQPASIQKSAQKLMHLAFTFIHIDAKHMITQFFIYLWLLVPVGAYVCMKHCDVTNTVGLKNTYMHIYNYSKNNCVPQWPDYLRWFINKDIKYSFYCSLCTRVPTTLKSEDLLHVCHKTYDRNIDFKLFAFIKNFKFISKRKQFAKWITLYNKNKQKLVHTLTNLQTDQE